VDPAPTGNVCLIICDSFAPQNAPERVGPLHDCATVANFLRRIDFSLYFLSNPTRQKFVEALKYFFAAQTTTTLIYYNGIAASVPAGPNPDDGRDEVVTVGGENIADDKLADILSKSGKPPNSRVIIVSESCHTGYSWNLCGTTFNGYTLPKGVLSIANRRNGSRDEDMTSEGRDDAGIFTFYLFRLLNDSEGITVKELEARLNGYLSRFSQFVMVTATSEEMLDRALLEKWVPVQH
jgi:hypothetical protein